MNSKNKKIIKERMFTMNLKNKKIFSRIAAGVMTVAMAITLLPGTMKTVNAAGTAENPVTSASVEVTLYKRAKVYAPNTTFEFTVKNLTKEEAIKTNNNKNLTPAFKDAPANAVTLKPADAVTLTLGKIVLTPAEEDLDETSIKKSLTFNLDKRQFTAMGTYRYEVKQTIGGYEGIKYDAGVRYLDVTVATDGENFFIESAELISYKGETREKSGAFVNTYGVKNPDPDHPTNPPVPNGTVNDLVISKKVTGNYGDRKKKFAFTITIDGKADGGEWYKLERTSGTSGESEPTKIEKGKVTSATIYLSDGESVKIYGLTEGDEYTIEELATDGADDYNTTFKTTVTGSDKAAVDGEGKEATGNIAKGTSLQTQTVAFTNNRTGSATGFVSSYGPYALMVVLAGAVAFVLFRKRRAEY